MGKINASNKIMSKNQKKRKYANKRNFFHKALSKRLFWNGIHSFLRWADARGSADIIYRIWCISL